MTTETKKACRLSQKAMLTHLRVSMWAGRKKDKSATQELCLSKGADSDAATVVVNYIPAKELKDIDAADTKVRNTWKAWTQPWIDGGIRILPSACFMEYSDDMRKAMAEYNKAVDEFIARYPVIVANAPDRLKKLLDGKSLPTATEVKGKFGIAMELMPVPDIADFRADVDDDELKALTAEATASMETLTKRMMSGVWGELAGLVETVAERLADPEASFRDGLVVKVQEMCKRISKFNLMEDENLEAMRKEVQQKLAHLNPVHMREDKVQRKAAAKEAQDLIKKMKAYV